MHRIALGLVCASITLPTIGSRGGADGPSEPPSPRRMSFHNRLLLNRAVLAGLRSIEVLVLVKQDAKAQAHSVAGDVARLGGRVVKTYAEVGYLRIELPPEHLVELVRSPEIDAYQIASLSRGAWYRDGPPESNASMFRGFEVRPISGPQPNPEHEDLPELTAAEARAPGFTADEDVGLGAWIRAHPTFDGRGVTIAVVESALPAFADPVFRTAMTLDGTAVPKIAGILNAVPADIDDETRVRLNTIADSTRSWATVEGRTYILPQPGKYRMGVFDVPGGGNVVQRFAVLESESSGDVWIDSNGDASFQDERPLADVDERFDPGILKVTYPQQLDVSFVMGRGVEPHVVHIYPGKSSHQSMTASVAVGNRTDDSLASGVAPNARLLLVRIHGASYDLAAMAEGFIAAARRDDVDVITSSTGLHLIPDTSADFAGLLFTRISAAYDKPIVNGAGNFGLMLGHVQAHGGALAVGGTLGPATYAAFYGGTRLPGLLVHPWSSAGPAIDGTIKPDFLAPMERIAAIPPWYRDLEVVPQKMPWRRVPPGYEISCCTSASSPYAAGVVALLISAARQSNVPYSISALRHALSMTARPLPGFQAHEQGNGALDIAAAWHALQNRVDPPRITASAGIVHPLAQYAAHGPTGSGILEFGGWTAGTKGSRVITFRRESGPSQPVTYRLAWTAHDGTFSTPSSVTLPLEVPVPVRVDVNVEQTGAHSGLLTLHDRSTGAVVFRTQATVVAPETIDPATGSLTLTGTVGNMRQNAHYLHVSPGAGALALELEVSRGVLMTTLVQSHGLMSNYYVQTHPMDVFSAGSGVQRLLMPDPDSGIWTLRLNNVSVKVPASLKLGPRDDSEAKYILRMKVLRASIRTAAASDGVSLELTNRGADLAAPVVEAWSGTLRTHRARFREDGLPNLVEITVPAGAVSLAVDLHPENTESNVELFLYDCTTGECFAYDIGFPAAKSQKFVVREPKAGRWVAAVNPAPIPISTGGFVLDEVITTGVPIRHPSSTPRARGETWRDAFQELPPSSDVQGGTPVVLFEVLDEAAERAEAEKPWSTHPSFVKLRDRPVAIATAIHRRPTASNNR